MLAFTSALSSLPFLPFWVPCIMPHTPAAPQSRSPQLTFAVFLSPAGGPESKRWTRVQFLDAVRAVHLPKGICQGGRSRMQGKKTVVAS